MAWFSNVFKGFRNETFAENGSIELLAKYELSTCSFVAHLVESGYNVFKYVLLKYCADVIVYIFFG